MIPCSSGNDVERLVAEYVDFNNYERINLDGGCTPVEIKSKAGESLALLQ